MTRLSTRAALSAMLALAVLVLVLTTAGLFRPDTAAADPRTTGKTTHTFANTRGDDTRSLAAAPPAGRRRMSRSTSRSAPGSTPKKRRLSRGVRAVQIANRLTGIPYVWGGASPRSGFDCSGLVQYVFGKLGIPLPHYTVSQYGHGRPVSRSSLRPGDLVFFYGLGHVGIYAGGGKYIHAPRAGSTVRWASLASNPSYYGARRIVAA